MTNLGYFDVPLFGVGDFSARSGETIVTTAQGDRNLLFGILALEMDFISRNALVSAVNAWVLDKSKPLGQILVDQSELSHDDHAMLEAVIDRHLQLHDGNPELSLAAIGPVEVIYDELQQIADPDVQASLQQFSKHHTRTLDLQPTVSFSTGRKTSASKRFHVLRPHAHGGLGEVYVARDDELNREVALKEINSRHEHKPENRARFIREAEITGRLEHPGIVPVYGLGQYDDGRPYYAMRFVKGESLKEAIDQFHAAEFHSEGERMLKLRNLLSRFIAVCNAVEYAHSRGVLHRDLKPSNIMLGKYGETLVVDWGLAKPLGERDSRSDVSEVTLIPASGSGSGETQPGTTIGTPAFMSPEQAAGRLAEIKEASDVYSLGATLYCLLSGKEPFEGESAGTVLSQVQQGAFRPPHERNPFVPLPLNSICLKAMSFKPEDRYASCEALATDIEHWMADEPVTVFDEPYLLRLGRWMRNHRVLVATSTALLITAVFGLLVGAILLGRANARIQEQREFADRRREEADRQRELAVSRGEEASAQRDQAVRQLYVSQLNLAERALNEGNAGRARELLESQRPDRTGGIDLRGWEWYFDWELCHRELFTGDAHTDEVTGVAFSPDGSRVATSSYDKTVIIWDPKQERKVQTLAGLSSQVLSVVFSPDGTLLASSARDAKTNVCIWNWNEGRQIRTLTGHPDRVYALAFSPDGKLIASGGTSKADTSVRIWDLAAGVERHRLEGHEGGVSSLAFSPDGRQLASGSYDKTVKLWDPESGSLNYTFHAHDHRVNSVSFSPDGRRLATASRDGTAKLWEVGGDRKTLFRVKVPGGNVQTIAFNPNGESFATGGEDAVVRIWSIVGGLEQRTFRGHTGPVRGVAFSPDGQQIASASADGTVKMWDCSPTSRVVPGGVHDGYVNSVAFCPSGQQLASGSSDGTVTIWSVDDGREVVNLAGHQDTVRSVAVSPDGNTIASAGRDQTVRIWSTTSGEELHCLTGHSGDVRHVAFNSTGSIIASGSSDQTVRLWNVADGSELCDLTGHSGGVRAVAFHPLAQQLASGSDDGTIGIWRTDTGQPLKRLPGPGGKIQTVAFSGDGALLAAGTSKGTLQLWDTNSWVQRKTLKGHTGGVYSVAFDVTGARFASCDSVGMLKIWDVHTGQEVATIRAHEDGVMSIAFDADGRRLVSGSKDKTVKLWEAPMTSN